MLRLVIPFFIFSIVSSSNYFTVASELPSADEENNAPLCVVNSEPRPCGSLCEPTCAKPEEIFCTPADKEGCKQECRCLKGFVRNPETKQCIEVADCPSIKCPTNSTLSICGSLCESTCDVPEPHRLLCPRIQCTKFLQDCRCNSGYLRRDKISRRCVLPADCPKKTCRKNEESVCGRTTCEQNCKNPDSFSECIATTCPAPCKCKLGFLRNDETGLCVPLKECPSQSCTTPSILDLSENEIQQ